MCAAITVKQNKLKTISGKLTNPRSEHLHSTTAPVGFISQQTATTAPLSSRDQGNQRNHILCSTSLDQITSQSCACLGST